MKYVFRYSAKTIVLDDSSSMFWTHHKGWRLVEDEGLLNELGIYFEMNRDDPRLIIPVSNLQDLVESMGY